MRPKLSGVTVDSAVKALFHGGFGGASLRWRSLSRRVYDAALCARPPTPDAPPSPTSGARSNLLAACPDGCTEAILAAHGFTVEFLFALSATTGFHFLEVATLRGK
jgi:hypothetical protein